MGSGLDAWFGSAVTAAAGAALFRHAKVGQLAVRNLHELLQPSLKVSRACGLGTRAVKPVVPGMAVIAGAGAAVAAVMRITAVVIVMGTAAVMRAVTVVPVASVPVVRPALTIPLRVLRTGRRGRSLFDREIDAAYVVDPYDFDLYRLPFGQKIPDIGHIRMGDF